MGIFEDAKAAHNRQKEICKSFFGSESTPELVKRLEEDFEKGGKAGVLGEIREWSGVKYHKTPKGWRPVGKGDKAPKAEEKKEAPKEVDKPKIDSSNKTAISYFNSLPTINKYSEEEDSVTEASITKLANEISGSGKIVKEIRAKVKTYDPGISWKAYNIKTDSVEYYKLQKKHIAGGGDRAIASKSVYKFDNKYSDGVSTLAEPVQSHTSGWKDYNTEKNQIEGWGDFFKTAIKQFEKETKEGEATSAPSVAPLSKKDLIMIKALTENIKALKTSIEEYSHRYTHEEIKQKEEPKNQFSDKSGELYTFEVDKDEDDISFYRIRSKGVTVGRIGMDGNIVTVADIDSKFQKKGIYTSFLKKYVEEHGEIKSVTRSEEAEQVWNSIKKSPPEGMIVKKSSDYNFDEIYILKKKSKEDSENESTTTQAKKHTESKAIDISDEPPTGAAIKWNHTVTISDLKDQAKFWLGLLNSFKEIMSQYGSINTDYSRQKNEYEAAYNWAIKKIKDNS